MQRPWSLTRVIDAAKEDLLAFEKAVFDCVMEFDQIGNEAAMSVFEGLRKLILG